jgi:hypothetical protein
MIDFSTTIQQKERTHITYLWEELISLPKIEEARSIVRAASNSSQT